MSIAQKFHPRILYRQDHFVKNERRNRKEDMRGILVYYVTLFFWHINAVKLSYPLFVYFVQASSSSSFIPSR